MKTLEVKRREAQIRNAARAKRTNKQQLALIANRRGKSLREVDRLT
jgi:hypothetical protein